MAISGIFSQQLNQLQAILLSILSAIVVGLPAALILFFFSQRNPILKCLGFLIAISSALIGLYANLVIASLMGKQESSVWAVNYFSSFII
jgi:hypothetical protein